MTLFKVGDSVRRISNPRRNLEVGNVRVVASINAGDPAKFKLFGVEGNYHAKYFELNSPSALLGIPGESDPNGLSLNAPGAKADAGKLRPTLILRDMSRALLAITKIATDGAAKYSDGGWILVPNGSERYEDASLRHMLKRFAGQEVDTDSGEAHLAHEAWNALAKLDLYLRNRETVC